MVTVATAPPGSAARLADLDVSRACEGDVEHFDEFRNDLPGFCEQLVPHRGKHRGAIFSAHHRGAMAENSGERPEDVVVGDERLPVIEREPHAMPEAIGIRFEQHLFGRYV